MIDFISEKKSYGAMMNDCGSGIGAIILKTRVTSQISKSLEPTIASSSEISLLKTKKLSQTLTE